MTDIEINMIEEYVAQKGCAICYIEIKEDNSFHIKIKKTNTESEIEFDFSNLQDFKKELNEKTKILKKSGQIYIKNIKLKDNKSRREIKKYKKNSPFSGNMKIKYTDIFIRTAEQIKDGFQNQESKYFNILEYYSESYLSSYNRILQNYNGISRDANLLELKKAYKEVAKNDLFKYLSDCVKTYKENCNNDYKSRIIASKAPIEGVHLLDKRYRVKYYKLRRNFMHMIVKSAEYVTSFGASHKKVSDKNFFNKYISLPYPSCYEEMDYNQFKNVIMLCVNKNVTENKKRKVNKFLFLPALGLGLDAKPVTMRKRNNTINISVKSFTRAVLTVFATSFIFTGSSVLKQNNPKILNNDLQYRNEVNELSLNFLPFGIGNFLDAKLSLLAANINYNKNNVTDKNMPVVNPEKELDLQEINSADAIGNPKFISLNNLLTDKANNETLPFANKNRGGQAEVVKNGNPGSTPKDNVPSGNMPNPDIMEDKPDTQNNENLQSENNPDMPNNENPQMNNQGNMPRVNTQNENPKSENNPDTPNNEDPQMNKQEDMPNTNMQNEDKQNEKIPENNQETPNNENPQENNQNESAPQPNTANENTPNPNEEDKNPVIPNESNPQNNNPDDNVQEHTLDNKNDLNENKPFESVPNENFQQENQLKNSAFNKNPNKIPSKPEDFNIGFNFSEPFKNKPNLFILKPPGSVDKKGNPKKNPKTNE